MKLEDIIKHLESLKSDPRFEQELLEIEIDVDCKNNAVYVSSQIQGEPSIEEQVEARAEAIEDLRNAIFCAFSDFGIRDGDFSCDFIARALYTQFSFESFIGASTQNNVFYNGDDKRIFERLIPIAKKIGILKR